MLDSSIANVALPTIARDLHVGAASIVWVVNAFNLAVTATLFAAAGFGTSFGFVRVYRAGVVLFTVGSLLCAIGNSFPLLILARVVQGLGAAAIMAMSPALLRSIFPRAQLMRAFGYTALTVSAAGAAGPTIGGLLLAVLPWPWLFAINVPVAIVAIALGVNSLPETPGSGARSDVASILASAVGFSLLVYGIDGITRHEAPVLIVAETLSGAAIFAWFVRRQFVVRVPLIAMDLFRLPVFSGAALTSFAAWMAWGIGFVTMPFVLQLDRGDSPLVAGLLLTAWPVGNALSAPLAGRLTERLPVATVASAGLGLFAIALVLFACFAHDASPLALLAFGALAGFGFGGFQAPNNGALLGAAPLEKSASASALLAVLRVGGQTLGASVVAIIFAWAERIDPAAFVRVAGPFALLLAAACALVAATMSVRRPATSGR